MVLSLSLDQVSFLDFFWNWGNSWLFHFWFALYLKWVCQKTSKFLWYWYFWKRHFRSKLVKILKVGYYGVISSSTTLLFQFNLKMMCLLVINCSFVFTCFWFSKASFQCLLWYAWHARKNRATDNLLTVMISFNILHFSVIRLFSTLTMSVCPIQWRVEIKRFSGNLCCLFINSRKTSFLIFN